MAEGDKENPWGFVKDILDALPFYVMITDETHHVIMANEAVAKDLGITPEELVGKYCPETVHGLSGPYPGCPVEEAAEKNESVVKEIYFHEYKRWYNSAAYLINKVSVNGKRIFLHMIQDIDESKKKEVELHDRIEELEKWQRLTVGRELRMAELKSEIMELKKALQEKKGEG